MKTQPPTTRRTNAFRQTLLERRATLKKEMDARIKTGGAGRLKESA